MIRLSSFEKRHANDEAERNSTRLQWSSPPIFGEAKPREDGRRNMFGMDEFKAAPKGIDKGHKYAPLYFFFFLPPMLMNDLHKDINLLAGHLLYFGGESFC